MMPPRRSTSVALWRPLKDARLGGRVAPAERQALDDAIAAVDGRVPCLNPDRRHLWLSEVDHEALEAQLRCLSCPVIAQCRDYRRKLLPTFGVWAGCYYPKERINR